MASCLIVSSQEKSTNALVQLIKSTTITTITTAKSSAEARRAMGIKEFDVVVINTPLSDEFGYDLANHLTSSTTSGVVMLIKNTILNEMYVKLMEYGAMCIGKPIDRMQLSQGIHMALSTHYRIVKIQKEKTRIEAKLEEMRIIDRTKYVLMECLNMSETEAHHYIEKEAMDKRLTKIMAAKRLLELYDEE